MVIGWIIDTAYGTYKVQAERGEVLRVTLRVGEMCYHLSPDDAEELARALLRAAEIRREIESEIEAVGE